MYFLFYLIINNKTEYLSKQVFVLIGWELHKKWQVHGNVNGMNNQKSLVIQALPATLLVKFEKGMQSKISNDACIHTQEKALKDQSWMIGWC